MPEPRSTLSVSAATTLVLAVEDELCALLGPAGELARTLASEMPKHQPEYPRLAQLADTLGFANALLCQIFSSTAEKRETCSAFSVDAMARDVLPMLRASVQGRARVTLSEDSHSPLLHGNPVALKRALLLVVRGLARTIAVADGLIEIGVALITVAHSACEAEHSEFASSRRVVRLTVADNGVGMDPTRIHGLLQGGPDGGPLASWEDAGLQIASSIVKAHGGLLDIESHAGIGTMVRIDLPLAWPSRASDSAP